jgi:hypothetical protein
MRGERKWLRTVLNPVLTRGSRKSFAILKLSEMTFRDNNLCFPATRKEHYLCHPKSV